MSNSKTTKTVETFPVREYNAILNVAAKRFASDIRIAKKYGIHQSPKQIVQDALDLVKLAALIEYNQIGRAANMANMLDTALRDDIPDFVWNLFERRNKR